MRQLYLLAAAAAVTTTPATATILFEPAHVSQGTLVHNPGNTKDVTAATVVADLGSKGPQIVNFDTMAPSADELTLQKGAGQSDITGTSDVVSGDIYLTGHADMSWIELGLTAESAGSIDFILTNSLGQTFNFEESIGPGNTHYGFLAAGGDPITNLFFEMDPLDSGGPNAITDIKQVRIIAGSAPIPEPATWAMVLAGFGAVGFTLRRSRKRLVPQLV